MKQRNGFISRLKTAARQRLHRLGLHGTVVLPEEQRHLQVCHDPSVPLPKRSCQSPRSRLWQRQGLGTQIRAMPVGQDQETAIVGFRRAY